jgi:hypothetical protein
MNKNVLQRPRDAVKNLIAALLLPEQPRRRIPGAVLASRSQRQSGTCFKWTQKRRPSAPARCAIVVSHATIKSRFAMAPVFVAGIESRMALRGPEGRGRWPETSPPDDNAASLGL